MAHFADGERTGCDIVHNQRKIIEKHSTPLFVQLYKKTSTWRRWGILGTIIPRAFGSFDCDKG